MSEQERCLFIGVGGCAVAIRPSDGREIWRTKLKMSAFVTVLSDGDAVFAGAGGELFCLDGATGAIRWRNRLKGLGNGLVVFAGSSAVAVAAALAAAEAAAAVAAIAATAAAAR